MKRILLCGLSPAFLLLITLGCQKKETRTQSSSESNKINPLKSHVNLRIWYDNGGKDYGCWLAGGNCLDDVIVTPWFADLITDFGSSSDQKAFATANYSSLSQLIDKNLLDEVIALHVKVSLRGRITSTEVGYLIFKQASGGGITSVNPFRQ